MSQSTIILHFLAKHCQFQTLLTHPKKLRFIFPGLRQHKFLSALFQTLGKESGILPLAIRLETP